MNAIGHIDAQGQTQRVDLSRRLYQSNGSARGAALILRAVLRVVNARLLHLAVAESMRCLWALPTKHGVMLAFQG